MSLRNSFASRIAVGLFIAILGGVGIGVRNSMEAQTTTPRQGETSTTLADGRVLIAGGDATGSAEILDPATGQTTVLSDQMHVARANHSAVRLADGNVLFVGGSVWGSSSIEQSGEVVDLGSAQFINTPGGSRTARLQPSLLLRADGVVVVTGGDAQGTTEFYDPATATFGLDPAAASIVTDRGDYSPFETVTFSGKRWAPVEL